ncbi:MAG: hypothetical protein BWK76_26375 [Desulfobulbaceae bacterium A2]|nr:MAG: hypothetical protein BWK76_26375 [Desulfobulbaceae bacterium A2]
MIQRSHKLTLLENSHSFVREAARNAIAASNDVSRWPFAILNLVQATELSLKEMLRRQHPVLIYDDVDTPRNTVSIMQALARIENPAIAGITIPGEEKRKLKSAVDLRNQITHFEFEITEEYAMAKFSELFAFLVYFQGRHLSVEIEDVLSADLLHPVIAIEKCFAELREKALARILDEKIEKENLWSCPECFEDTLVFDGSQGICYLCRASQTIVECPHCGKERLDFDVEDFTDLLDSDYDEGQVHIYNDYGYDQHKACSACMDEIKAHIEQQRLDEYCNDMEEAEWHRRRAQQQGGGYSPPAARSSKPTP